NAKQLWLQFQGQLADLVQKNGSALSEFKATRSTGGSTRKGTPLVTEKFTFRKCGGDGRAVYTNERLRGTIACFMNCARYQFLARAGFAYYQNFVWCGRHLSNRRNDFVNRRAFAHNFANRLMLGDFAVKIGGLCLQLAQAVLGSQLILHIPQNDAVPTAARQVETKKACLSGELRTVPQQGIETAWDSGRVLAGSVQFLGNRG